MTAITVSGVLQQRGAHQRGEPAGDRDADPDTEDVAGTAAGPLHPGRARQALRDVGDEDRGEDGGAHPSAADEAQAEHDGFGDAVEERADRDGGSASALLFLAGLLFS
jgi:hypothetical protein